MDMEGDISDLKSFLNKLKKPPKPAVISYIKIKKGEYIGCKGFKIETSKIDNQENKFMPYDVGICSESLDDIWDFKNRNYHYSFMNCTSCRPRL